MAPCCLVEELPGGGAYLQLTASLLDFLQTDFIDRLKALDEYLRVVKIPGAPEPIWRF